MKRSTLIILTLILLFPLIPHDLSTAQSQPESDAPYIYYYSDLLNAFVIERADGTDSRTLGDDLIPEDTNTIAGAGWSPSGEWFAWTAAWIGGYGETHRGYKPGVVHVSGQHHMTALDNIHDARMAWHPTEDLLFVAGVTVETDYDAVPRSDSSHIRMTLIDPNGDSIISSVEIERFVRGQSYQEAVPQIFWYDDEYAIAYYEERLDPYSSDAIQEVTIFFVFDMEGSVSTHVYPRVARQSDVYYMPAISEDGYVLYQNADQTIIIENVVTGYQQYFDDADDMIVRTVDWHDDRQSATIEGYDRTCDPISSCPITRTFSFQHISELTPLPPPSEVTTVDIQIRRACQEANTDYVALPFAGESDSSPYQFTLYDCEEFTAIDTYEIPFGSISLSVSADGRYVATAGYGIRIFDIAAKTSIVLPPDGRSYNADSGGYVLWHPEQAWFFSGESSSRAGGGGGPLYLGVVSADGIVNRDLTVCGLSEPCIGWLPDRVDRALLSEGQTTPMIPEPDHILRGTDWSFYLSWSPDGQRITRAMRHFGEPIGETTMLDAHTGEVLSVLPPIDNFRTVIDWLQTSNGTYTATIINKSIEQPQYGRWTWAISPDQRYAAIELDAYSGIVLYDIVAQEQIFEFGHPGYPVVVFSPDSRYVVYSGPYQPLQIWDVETGAMVSRINTNATAVAFSPDGQTLAVASSWDIQLWDVETLLTTTN